MSSGVVVSHRAKLVAFMAAAVLAAAMALGAAPAYAADLAAGSIAGADEGSALQVQAAGANLKAAKAKYDVDDDNVLEATSVKEMKSQLKAAGKSATTSERYIVYVPSGSYKVDAISIPQNVIFVAEDGVKFTSDEANNAMFTVNGSLYGGYYDGDFMTRNCIYFGKHKFSGYNGIVESATVTRAFAQDIVAMDPTCQNAQVINCTTTKAKENGICVLKGASYKLVSGCTASDNTWSGINISHSNIKTIENCVVENNGDKGVSTNTDPLKGYNQPGCAIGKITGCTFKNNKINGVYLKPKCTLGEFSDNTVIGNGDGLVVCGKTAYGTKGKAYAKKVKNNVFKNNKRGQIVAQDKGATVYVASGNKLTGGNDSSILASTKGVVKITGKNNVIKGCKKAGISVNDGGSLTISGDNTKIQKSGTQGIYARAGKVTISGDGTEISGNKKMGIAIYKKSTLTVTGADTDVESNKTTGVNIAEKSKLVVKGKGMTISGSTDMGLTLKGSTAKITGASFAVKSSKSAGIGLYQKSKLTLSGKKAVLSKNGSYGVYATDKSTATLKNVTFSGNKFGDTYAKGRATIKK